jgi:hypothetical protein
MLEKVEINDAGAIALLKSTAVRADLEARARRIAESAGAGSFEVTSHDTPTRVRVSVVTADYDARKSEAEDRSLLRALEAGRG